MSQLTRVIGIDPGSTITGYGVIDSDGVRSVYVTHGHIRVKGENFPDRLGHIHQAIGEVIDEWKPTSAAIEQVFISNNPMSALKLGQARGAAITAVVSRGLGMSEYAARTVKQVVTGSGAADKTAVTTMIKAHLDITRAVQVDAADGLAIALCHAHSALGGTRAILASATAGTSTRRRSRGRGLRW